jgi:hypothetical protein
VVARKHTATSILSNFRNRLKKVVDLANTHRLGEFADGAGGCESSLGAADSRFI